MSGEKKKYFKNQAGEKLSYPNYRLKLNKENPAKLEGYRKNFKSLSARLRKSESIKSQEDHELMLRFSISKRSQPRNMIMSTALLLTTLSSVQALEDKTDQSSSKFSNIFDPNQLTNKKEISGFSSANSSTTFSTTTATFNQQVKKNLLTQDDLSKIADSLKIKSASKKPLEEFKDEDLHNLITKEKTTTEIVKLYLLGLNGDKNLILKSLTKIDEDKFTPLLFSIKTKNDPALFKEMLSYVDDSPSFSKLITLSCSQQSHSFLNYAFDSSSSEFIDIIDQHITSIAQKEASKDKSIADIRKELWQKALRQKGLFGKDQYLYPLYIAQGKPQNIKKILAIAKKFGDEFLVEILNQENLENKDTLLILESFLENHDSLIAILDSLKDNKDALLKVLTKTNIYEDNSLTYIIFKKNSENFATMLSYVDDSASFSKLINIAVSQESRSFLKFAFDPSSSAFIDIIDQQITSIAQKEASKDKSSEDIYKELWQKALRQVAYSKQNILKYPFYYSQGKPQNIKKILAIAKKFGDEFLVEILNQENFESKNSLLLYESITQNNDCLIAILDSLKDNKDELLKVLTKTNIFKYNSLVYLISKESPENFATMLSYVDDSASFSKLITSCGSQESHSFLNYAFTASSSEFIDIIDQQITRIAQKEASKDKSIADIRKELWQKALRQKGLWGKDEYLYPLYIAQGKPQNIKKILAIAKKFGDEFLVEILNQENSENKDTLLILESFNQNNESIGIIFDSIKDNKDALN
ncbi:MAG: hypothetical protein RL769_434, partial [Pseudomonadota bacterium]